MSKLHFRDRFGAIQQVLHFSHCPDAHSQFPKQNPAILGLDSICHQGNYAAHQSETVLSAVLQFPEQDIYLIQGFTQGYLCFFSLGDICHHPQ